MRIGIDAKWYFTGNISGRVVIVNLLEALAELNSNHKFIVILNFKDKERPFPLSSNPNFEIVYLKTYTNQLTNILSPLFLRKYNLDVCVYQYFAPPFSFFKRIAYIHDIIFESSPEYFSSLERLYFKSMKLFALRCQGIVTVSETEKKRLLKYKYNKSENIVAIHNGINQRFHIQLNPSEDKKQAIRSKYNLPDRFILYLGRINERKNVPNLIKAFAETQTKNISLVIAGEKDWSKSNIKDVIQQENLENRVKCIGFVDGEDLQLLYYIASAFCYLSFDEGFGLPVAEAMACGIPVVVSDTLVHREICGQAAFYVNPTDISDIAAMIDTVVNTSSTLLHSRLELGQSLAKQYSWGSSAEKLIQFIEKL